ncbi:MAG TPA: hypothetical protein VK249_27325 [Anaerolineales bacterium]|nr:hypothetical protein [Anaerolineales bacterium]
MRNLMLKVLVSVLALQALFFASPAVVQAQETTCPPPTPVSVDIKPGDYPNQIKLSARGVLPVALLGTPDFNAGQFTPEMAHLSDAVLATTTECAGAAAIRWNYEDVNSDGRLDLVFFFRIQDLNLTPGSTAATLMAHGAYNSTVIHTVGTDSVQVKP